MSQRAQARRCACLSAIALFAGLAILLAGPVTLAGAAAPAPVATAAAGCAAAAAAVGQASKRSLVAAVRCLVNASRRASGLRPLRPDGRLARAARHHARAMAGRRLLSHTLPGSRSFAQRLRATGFSGLAGEALSWGCGRAASPRSTVTGWLNSPGHRAVVLNRGYRRVGVAVAIGGSRCGGAGYWTLVAGG